MRRRCTKIFRGCNPSLSQRFGVLIVLCIVIILIQLHIVMKTERSSGLNGLPLATQQQYQQQQQQQQHQRQEQPRKHVTVHTESKYREFPMYRHTEFGVTSRVDEVSHVEPKIIMLYDFPEYVLHDHFQNVNINKCDFNDCDIVYANASFGSDLSHADVILFYGNRLPKNPPKRKSAEQIFIFVSMESPGNQATQKILKHWENQFNWTMTYRLNAEIPIPHGLILNRGDKTPVNPGIPYRSAGFHGNNKHLKTNNGLKYFKRNYSQIIKSKTSLVTWIHNTCKTDSKSEEYVQLLQKYITVDTYGYCSQSEDKRKSYKVSNIIRDYKFFLAFEDVMCVDYISERVFTLFEKDIVLVVRGSRTYSEHFPKGTYIDTNDFPSPMKLARELQRLDRNQGHYQRMIQRKDLYVKMQISEIGQSALCEICKRMNDTNSYRKTVMNIDKWWKPEHHCVFPYDIQPFKPFVPK